jgi:tetratricopeptide (TPR) repeat protein
LESAGSNNAAGLAMSGNENSPDTETKVVSYPKKYWWLILVLLPIALALLKIIPDLRSKKEGGGSAFSNQQTGNNNVAISGSGNILNSDLSTKTYVISMAAIEKEYAAIKREPLKDEELKKQIQAALDLLEAGKPEESAAAFQAINRKISLPALQTDLGVAYQKAGDAKASAQAFSKALEQDPKYAPAHHNLGLVKASRGELVEAREHFEKSNGIGESKALAKAIQQELKNQDSELEPNNKASEANILPLEKAVAGNITDGDDSDFFRITTPPKYRDIVEVLINNSSPKLQPGVAIFDANKSALPGKWNDTPNANLDHLFSVPPDTTFFVQVYGRSHSTGRYTITVKALKKYDSYEPNDDILDPADIELGKQIIANIMDGDDVDFFRFNTAATGATVTADIGNRSHQTLQPGVAVFDADKSALPGTWNDTPGANLHHSFHVQPNVAYYIQIYGRSHSSGDYTLILTQQ